MSTASATQGEVKKAGEENLLPQETRIMDNWSYLFTWLGGCVSIGTFTMGSSLIGALNLTQAILSMMVACTIIAAGLAINGRAGHIFGIPFTIQARSAFGIVGTKFPGFIRAVPAVVWFGFQSWVGAGALNLVSESLIGFNNIWFYFVVFQGIQVGLSVLGFHGIKWLENIGAVFILGSLAYMFYSVVNKYGVEISATLVNVEGSWGLPFWGGTTAFLGIYSTMMLNVSDYSRELKKTTKTSLAGFIYWSSILPATLFMGLIGLMVSSATGIADPIKVFSSAVDNQLLLIVTLLFIAFAQVTTNILNNVVPPAYVLMDAFKWSYKKCAVAVGILSCFTFPWKLVQDDSASGLQIFVLTYSAFLGPIFAILLVDFYVLRKQKLDLVELYKEDGNYRGINYAAIIATFVGAAVAFIEVKLSWYSSLIPAGLTYYILMKTMPSAQRFLK